MNSDFKQLIELQDILSEKDFQELAIKIPVATLLENWDLIPDGITKNLFNALWLEDKIIILTSLAPSDLGALLLKLNENEIKYLLNEIEPDDLADILQTVDPETRQTVWSGLSDETKEETLFLLKFDEDDAAGLMNPRYLAIRSSLTIKQAINFVRKNVHEIETIYYIYVIDYLKRLIGVVSIKDLLSYDDETRISEIMEREVVSVLSDTDQEEVAKRLETYNLMAMPVVDKDNKLLGIVTFDDVIDVIREEQTEDLYKMQGMSGQTERYMDLTPFQLVLKRIPWLIVLLILGTATTLIMDFYMPSDNPAAALSHLFPAIIAIYVPIIIGTGGNTGGQSSTLIIRGLATGEIHIRDIGAIIWKEFLVSIMLAFAIGVVIFTRCLLVPPHATWIEATAITSALALIVVTSNLIGAIAPILISSVKLDPAVMSTPLMSTLIDVTGLVIYFEIAKLFLHLAG